MFAARPAAHPSFANPVRRIALTIAVASSLAAVPALAQTNPVDPNGPPTPLVTGDTVTVAVAGAWLPDYEGSNDYSLTPGPAAIGTLGGISFQVLGNRASVDLIADAPTSRWDFQAGPVGLVNFNRTSRKGIDDPRVKALPTTSTALELGGYLGIGRTGLITSDYDKLSVAVSYRYDVTGIHDSGVLQPSVSYYTPLSLKSAVGIFASAEKVERAYGRTYFDVRPQDVAASGLPAFRTRGGWKNYVVGFAGTYALTGDLLHGFKVIAGGTYKRMLNDFGDTPIVSIAGSRNQWLGAVGIGYTF